MSDALDRVQKAIQEGTRYQTSDIIDLIENTPEGVTVVCDEDHKGKIYTVSIDSKHHIVYYSAHKN